MEKKEFFSKNLPANILKTEQNIAELSFCSSKLARKELNYQEARKYEVLPLAITSSQQGKIISFACCTDNTTDLEKTLSFITSCQVKLMPVEKQKLLPAIFTAYKADDASLVQSKQELLEVLPDKFIKLKYNNFQTAKNPESIFLEKLIEYAIARQASDIHLIPRDIGSVVKLRIDGELFEHEEALCSLSQHKLIVNRLKVLADLNLSESRMPQDGILEMPVMTGNIPIRLSLMPTIFGEKAVLRIQLNSRLYSLSELGFSSTTYKFILKAIENLQGLVLFCGPTGSGKTSSMYAALRELSLKNCSIASIEDPVEIPFSLVDQTSINISSGLTYPVCLKSVLRQDPDVILIGEIRDAESAKIAIQAALSGHLIFTTVHSGNVFQSVSRLKNLAVPTELLAEALKLIISQRLLPCLCKHCKAIDLKGSNKSSQEIYRAVGCNRCSGSGYLNRQIITESLFVSKTIRKKIAENQFSVHNKLVRYYDSHKKQLEKFLFAGKIDFLTFNRFLNHE